MAEPRIEILDTPAEAIAVIRELQREGIPRSAITVMSSEPLHLGTPDLPDGPKTGIAGFAIAGGLIGAALAVLLTVWTSRKVGLITGGMPIVSPWAFGIIVFELTALGAILAILGRMITEGRLGGRLPVTEYDESVTQGKIVLVIRCADQDEIPSS